jgi:hypothetical protein
VDIQIPDAIRGSTNPCATVTTRMVADGVGYLAGGTHHGVAIEMKDSAIVVERPPSDAARTHRADGGGGRDDRPRPRNDR